MAETVIETMSAASWGSNSRGAIRDSYSTRAVDGGAGNGDWVGGLMGFTGSGIGSSYSRGNVDGGLGTGDWVGAVAGFGTSGGGVYGFGTVTGDEGNGFDGAARPGTVDSPDDFTATGDNSPGESWNSGAWNFATSENPALVYNDYDGSETDFASCDDGNNGGFPAYIDRELSQTQRTGME